MIYLIFRCKPINVNARSLLLARTSDSVFASNLSRNGYAVLAIREEDYSLNYWL